MFFEHPGGNGAVVLKNGYADAIWIALAITHGQMRINQSVLDVARELGLADPPSWLLHPFYRDFNLLQSPFVSREAACNTIARAQRCGLDAITWTANFVRVSCNNPHVFQRIQHGERGLIEYYRSICWPEWAAEGNPVRALVLHPTLARGNEAQYRPTSPYFGIAPRNQVLTARTVDPRQSARRIAEPTEVELSTFKQDMLGRSVAPIDRLETIEEEVEFAEVGVMTDPVEEDEDFDELMVEEDHAM
ncbi:hypothetical protein EVJ58_g7522 [Rhodofomes roseus]|uniref:Uncharacterized protein n=1 Tax=Rhodofomes roseus TaxID=34475 RepID=A0A4Y9Y3F9_9APHY|nr:hypothetical protein EVJ58_g7522 [Rhodofomes roseus]